jgi:hypothetical protein
MPGLFEDRCQICNGIIPSAFNTDEALQICPKCQLRESQHNRASDIPKTQQRLIL